MLVVCSRIGDRFENMGLKWNRQERCLICKHVGALINHLRKNCYRNFLIGKGNFALAA